MLGAGCDALHVRADSPPQTYFFTSAAMVGGPGLLGVAAGVMVLSAATCVGYHRRARLAAAAGAPRGAHVSYQGAGELVADEDEGEEAPLLSPGPLGVC